MEFVKILRQDSPSVGHGAEIPASWREVSPGFAILMQHYSGCSFGVGVYRIHPAAELVKWTDLAAAMFPDYAGRMLCLSSDWLGRQFALDAQRTRHNECLMLMLDPGAGEVLEVSATLTEFHDSEIIEHSDAVLVANAFRDWLSRGHAAPGPSQCVGYKAPLFLNGADGFENMELIDMAVYWDIHGQIWTEVKNLPEGTPIGRIDIAGQDDKSEIGHS